MNQLLPLNQNIQLDLEGAAPCITEQYLGSGGEGEVYKAILNNRYYALKWYYPNTATPEQADAIRDLIQKGSPDNRFLWPISLARLDSHKGFGYLMPLREARYRNLSELMKRHIHPSFRSLVTACFQLADSFHQLHSKGLCYKDISLGNVFFDPNTGDVLICDNDNVRENGKLSKIGGTLGFMAPEIVLGKSPPNRESDLFSLANLLFHLLHIHHPLHGALEANIKSFDLPAQHRLYGENPVFVFDPQNTSNRPVRGYQDNALIFWQIYPQFVRDLFIKAFTRGIRDVEHGRVRETEWRDALSKLRDIIFYCSHCGEQNFYDVETLQQQNELAKCWYCKKTPIMPLRMRLTQEQGSSIIMLNRDTQLFPHHLARKRYDFSIPLAEVTQHPNDPNIWGLKNLSSFNWTINKPDGSIVEVIAGQSAILTANVRINFGTVLGDVRV